MCEVTPFPKSFPFPKLHVRRTSATSRSVFFFYSPPFGSTRHVCLFGILVRQSDRVWYPLLPFRWTFFSIRLSPNGLLNGFTPLDISANIPLLSCFLPPFSFLHPRRFMVLFIGTVPCPSPLPIRRAHCLTKTVNGLPSQSQTPT